MDIDYKKRQGYIKAKKRVKNIQLFYIHFVGYLVLVTLLVYNLFIVEGEYKNNIVVLNLSVLLAWTIFIIIHGLKAFKGRILFKKDWENRKMQDFLDKDEEEETTIWE